VSESTEDRADALFHALSDRTRRDILRRVLAGEHSVTTLAASYDMSFAAVQKHVAVLERAGLLTKRRSGREQLASGDVQAVRSVASMLDELESVWRGRVARIDELLHTTGTTNGTTTTTTNTTKET
jgi:DNA-binding transcriptional ArsR family regulator